MADRGYRNRAYIFDEGDGGQPADRRSNTSSSSRSTVHRFIERKLKSGGKIRWAILLVGVIVGIVLIAAIATAVYFLQDNSNDTRLKQVVEDETVPSSTMLPVVASTSAPRTSHKATPTTTVIGTTKARSTHKPSVVTTEHPMTTHSRIQTTVTSPAVTTPFEDKSTPNNLQVTMGTIEYQVGDRTVKLVCRGFHSGNWSTLTIRKQFKDGYEPIAVTMNSGDPATVTVFTPRATYTLVEKAYELVMTVHLDINCTDLTNYSCALVADSGTANEVADLRITMPTPEIVVPHVVIESQEVTLQCIVDAWEASGNIVWEYKRPRSDRFTNFTVNPTTVKTDRDCLTTINSSLTFNVSMHENGSDFRCRVVYSGGEVIRSQISHKMADVNLMVVAAAFCEDKDHFTIHAHPHYPCSLVVYCLDVGPTVYEIECDAGECYDADRTKCVPQNR